MDTNRVYHVLTSAGPREQYKWLWEAGSYTERLWSTNSNSKSFKNWLAEECCRFIGHKLLAWHSPPSSSAWLVTILTNLYTYLLRSYQAMFLYIKDNFGRYLERIDEAVREAKELAQGSSFSWLSLLLILEFYFTMFHYIYLFQTHTNVFICFSRRQSSSSRLIASIWI